jgi:hypothetical protein
MGVVKVEMTLRGNFASLVFFLNGVFLSFGVLSFRSCRLLRLLLSDCVSSSLAALRRASLLSAREFLGAM